MRTNVLAAALVAAAVWLPACGLDDLGVRSVSFELHSQPVLEPPAGIDGPTLIALMGAMGTANAVVGTGDLHVAAMGLPVLPDGFGYMAMGSFAEHSREAIPGAEDEAPTGHSHGALTSASGDFGAEDHVLETIVLGPLELGEEPGSWEVELSATDLDVEIGALRAAMIMLIPDGGAAVMVLAGEVGADEAASGSGEEGGHTHGP